MGKKGTKRKTRWRVLPIGEDGGSGSGNEEEGECENGACAGSGSYARATQQHRPIRRPNGGRPGGGGGGYYGNKQHGGGPRSYGNNHHDNSHHQPLVTTEKHIFNEEEYTKITTPRQDVLFKKGYLGRKRPTVPAEPSEQTSSADVSNGNAVHYDPSSGHNEGLDNDPNEMVEEQPQFIYTNGFLDQSGVYYINGSGYEIFDPYSGQVTAVVVGPHYGPNGGPPVLAAVPCQPVPLQPLEWFNPPGFLPYVTAPGPAGVPRDRRKRYSTDSQNCSPQSSESTGPPGSPQESDEVALNGGPPEGAVYTPHHPPPPPPPYVYPGYMFGAPMYNMNGVTVQSTPNSAPTTDVGGKRRKKKRRRRRRRNGAEDGGSEESSSEEKEEPMSVTSQESSLESDSKLSNPGENPRPPASKSHAHTQTVEDVVECDQRPSLEPAPSENRDAATETADFESPPPPPPPQLNGYPEPELHSPTLNGVASPTPNRDIAVVNGADRLVNGHELKSKGDRKTEKKNKKTNPPILTNGVLEKPPREVSVKQIDECDDFAFQDESFLYTQEFINGNVKVELDDEENEWITVKGHKGSQGKRSEEKRVVPPELTNGHARFNNRVNGKEKASPGYKSGATKTEKNYYNSNGRVEERCTQNTKPRQSETKEKTQPNNGKGKATVNGVVGMDGNEREDGDEKAIVPEVAPEEAIATPSKPSRRERRSQMLQSKNGGGVGSTTPPETPSVSLRPETFARRGEDVVSPKQSDRLSREDSLLAALTVSTTDEQAVLAVLKEAVTVEEVVAAVKEAVSGKDTSKKPNSDVSSKKTNGNGVKKKKNPDTFKSPDLTTTKSTQPEVVEALAVRQEVGEAMAARAAESSATADLIAHESGRHQQEEEVTSSTPPIPPPRRKRWHPSGGRAPTFAKGESTGEESCSSCSSSSSSSPESEESVIECLSSGLNSPKVKLSPSGFSSSSSSDEDIIYRAGGEERDTNALGRISESQEESSSLNGRPMRRDASPGKPPCKEEAPKPDPLPLQTSSQSEAEDAASHDTNASEEHSKSVERISQTPMQTIASQDRSSRDVTVTNTNKEHLESVRRIPAQAVETQDASKDASSQQVSDSSDDHLRSVRRIAQEIVDSIIREALAESVRLKRDHSHHDPVKLGITDAVTRWLRSQSPDVLSLPRNEDSDGDLSDAAEADELEKPPTGPKNLKSNPLPAPSVENVDDDCRLDAQSAIGEDDGAGRRVAKTTSEKKKRHHLKDSRNDVAARTPDFDDDDDAISNASAASCGEWDLWDCHHTIPQDYDEILNKPRHKHTKSTNETNIISPGRKQARSPSHKCPHSPVPKYDPLANDTFSPIESTVMTEVVGEGASGRDRCSSICDPTLSVAKYYILGAHASLSPVEDLECCSEASEASSLTERPQDGYRVSLAEELARLEQPLPESWAVEPIRVGRCRCGGVAAAASHPVDSGVESAGEDGSSFVRKRESVSVFKRKLVGRLKGEGTPFPYGGICCILQ